MAALVAAAWAAAAASPPGDVDPRFLRVTVYGVDERNLSGAPLDADEEGRYSATQLIWCRSASGRFWGTSGNLAGDFMHGVGVAHAFYDSQTRRRVLPRDCKFRVYDRRGVLLEEVAITRYKSRWQDDGLYGNPDQDLMMFELASRPEHVDNILPVATYRAHAGDEILLVAFHYDVEPPFTKRKTRGRVYPNIGTAWEGAGNYFVTDVDAAPMSSGGAIYDSKGVFMGMIRGSTSPGTGPPRRFDPVREYNQGVRFDARFVREFDEFVNSRR